MQDFTKKKTGKDKKRYYPTLIIDKEVIEYTFIKSRPKTKEELGNDLRLKATRIFKPVATIVSVYIDLKDIKYIEYNKETDSVFLAGQFTVSYKNDYLKNEITKEYIDKLYCIEFPYNNFLDVDEFMELASKNIKVDRLMEEVTPISL